MRLSYDYHARLAELVHALVLGTSGATLGSSSLPSRTNMNLTSVVKQFVKETRKYLRVVSCVVRQQRCRLIGKGALKLNRNLNEKVLGTSSATSGGSSPFSRTIKD